MLRTVTVALPDSHHDVQQPQPAPVPRCCSVAIAIVAT